MVILKGSERYRLNLQAFPILPNLIDVLTSLDHTAPTYFGGVAPGQEAFDLHYYHQGQMYGFTWSVIKTLAAAPIPKDVIQFSKYEDARMGEMMVSNSCQYQPLYETCTWTVLYSRYDEESALMSQLSLPTKPDCNEEHNRTVCDPHTPPKGGWEAYPPPSPDLRTGLVRYNFNDLMGPKWWNWVAGVDRAVGWHPLKRDQVSTLSKWGVGDD